MNHLRIIPNLASLLPGLALTFFVGCSDDGGAAPTGPKGGIVEVDNDGIPLGEDDGPVRPGGTGGTGGSGGVPGMPAAGSSDLGKACEAEQDCQGGLTCRRDTEDYIAHLQCSTRCDATEECEAIEPGSCCIGAHTCVHACETNADCGPKTRCNGSGWCERKGPGSGVSYCSGTPLPCSLQTGTSCTTTLGCTDDSECSGVASSCYAQFDSFSCNQQEGCFWSSSSKDCSGVARSCGNIFSEYSCENQQGCYYSARCGGTPLSCETLTLELCAIQPGCIIEPG